MLWAAELFPALTEGPYASQSGKLLFVQIMCLLSVTNHKHYELSGFTNYKESVSKRSRLTLYDGRFLYTETIKLYCMNAFIAKGKYCFSVCICPNKQCSFEPRCVRIWFWDACSHSCFRCLRIS